LKTEITQLLRKTIFWTIRLINSKLSELENSSDS